MRLAPWPLRVIAVIVSLGIAAAAVPGSAVAQCVFDMPNGSASYVASITTSLVRAFVSCNNPGGNGASSESQAGVPTCQPVETFDQHNGAVSGGWQWASGSSYGRLAITRVSANNPDYPLSLRDAAVKLKLYHVESTSGGPASGTGTLFLFLRTTFDDPQGGDMTSYDFPYYFPFTLNGSGSVSVTKKFAEILAQIGQPPFPDCSSLELLSAFVRDPNGNTFAVPGMKLK